MSSKFIFIGLTVVLLSACVKVNILPENAIRNTFSAGKNLYDETKIKSRGGKKKRLSSQVIIASYPSKAEAESSCLAMLKDRLNNIPSKKPAVVLSEEAFIADGIKAEIIECQIVGYIWP